MGSTSWRADRCGRDGRSPSVEGEALKIAAIDRCGGARSGAARGGQGAGRRDQGARREGPEAPAQERGQGARGGGRVGAHRHDQPAAAVRGRPARVQDPRRARCARPASTSRRPRRTAAPRSPGSAPCSRWSGSTAPPTPRTGASCSGSPTPIRWCTSGRCRRACWPAAATRCAPSCSGLGLQISPTKTARDRLARVHPDLADRPALPLRRPARLARRDLRPAAAGLRPRDVRRRGAVPAPARPGHPEVRAGRHARGLAHGGRGAGAGQRSAGPRPEPPRSPARWCA